MKNYKEVESLVVAYQSTKDPIIFGKIYNLYYENLYIYIYKITGIRDVAFDLTQNTFIKASSKIDLLKLPAYFPLWLFRIAKNEAFHYLKKQRLDTDIDISAEMKYTSDNETDYEIEKDVDENIILLSTLIDQLSQEDKYLIQEKYYNDKSIMELCDDLHLGESAVKMKIYRVRQKLQKQMLLSKVG